LGLRWATDGMAGGPRLLLRKGRSRLLVGPAPLTEIPAQNPLWLEFPVPVLPVAGVSAIIRCYQTVVISLNVCALA
jgi:hypothetical protein